MMGTVVGSCKHGSKSCFLERRGILALQGELYSMEFIYRGTYVGNLGLFLLPANPFMNVASFPFASLFH
jgi:hypothetical protein